ncbi:phage regulatory CII family protein [Stenotrophomonas rhizophila]|uniref:phage regulatory CII family protein n=1 Tax=Stenotrophomonas rhizophila TaxID=216778 RepID=UPI0028D7D0E3|nr:phage regulatory CII family protein [Stenotrophomonas rhizophila]
MTCRTSSINWLDCLYNAVRKTPGGVIEAAKWLTDRRGKSMHPETLRAKLNGTEGESVTIEIAELLTEWMQEKAGGSEYALEWMQALAGQFGMSVDVVPPAPEGGWPNEMTAIQMKLLEITSRVGNLSGAAVDALADSRITSAEAGLMISEIRALRTMAHRLERNVARAAGKGKQAGRAAR